MKADRHFISKRVVSIKSMLLCKLCLNQLFLILLLALQTQIFAQVYPVRVTPQLIPPYDLKLASYATTSTEKLYVNLLLADINEQGRQVRLKMSIEGQGLNIQNPDFVTGATPILLDGGINLRLSNLDLQPYFSLNNLQGITAQQYNQPLPDGLYNFCFEVFDFNTGRSISQKSCTSAFLVLNDPPILNVPGKNELVLAQLPQNVVFTWTPRHLNATNVEYEFILKEIWDGGMDLRAAFQSSPIFQQITTQATTLLYGPSEVQMIEGKTYAWQVRALVNDGISEASIFRNNGLSEISWFNYTSECQPPAYVLSEAKSSQSVLISWQNMEHLRYDIQYRKFGSTSEEDWFSQSSYSDQVILHNLEPGTKYQFRVGGECTAGQGFSYSQIGNFTTPTNDEEAYYNCGVVPTIEITNYEPLPDLNIGEVFTAGDFPVTVKAVSGSQGIFSGWGFIVVPYLGDTRIKVAFEHININTDFQMTQGIVETDYDPEWENVDFVDDLTEVLEGDNDKKEITIDFDITEDDITVNEDGSITIDDPNSEISIDYAGGDDVVIKDKSGDVFHIDEEGNVSKGGVEAEGGSMDNVSTDGISPQGEVSAITAPGIRVTFISGNYQYGFDEIPPGEKSSLRNEYKHVADSEGNDYFFVHKAIKNGESDQIKAKVEIMDDSLSIDDLVIKTKQGENINYTVQGDEITLDLRGHYTFENEEIIATIQPKEGTTDKETIAGSFTLWHMSEKEANVTIVPVNRVSLPSATALQESLNNIYGKAMVKLNVSVAPSYSLPSSTYGGDHIAMDDSGLLANYTTDQQAVIRHYKTNGPYNPDAYYLFVFGGDVQPDRSEVAGFMPIGRQFGFVFSSNLHALEGGKTSLSGTMAHELGHGIFGLSHPFDQYGTTQKGTPWLMDYSDNGFSFSHMDWAQIHNPDLKFYLFQDEDEGAYKMADGSLYYKILQTVRCAIYNDTYTIDSEWLDRITTPYEANTLAPTKKWGELSIVRQDINKKIPTTVNSIDYNQTTTIYVTPKDGLPVRKAFKYKTSLGFADIYSNKNLTQYFAPTEEDLSADLNEVLQKIDLDNLSEEHVSDLKSIAACATTNLDPLTRFKLIKGIWGISNSEKYEDLILDLILTTKNGQDSRDLYRYLSDDTKLLKDFTDIDNVTNILGFDVGNENNFDRLATELITLFYKGHTPKDLSTIYDTLSNDKKLYFYQHSSDNSIICDAWDIKATLINQNIEFTETNYTLVIANTGGAASYNPCQEIGSETYDLPINSAIAVHVDKELSVELGISNGTYILPSFAYYILIEAENNKQLKTNIDAFLFIAGILTPFDEFYLLGKATRLARTGYRAAKLSTVQKFSRNKKLIIELDDAGKALKNEAGSKLDEYVEFVDDIANSTDDLLLSIKNKVPESTWGDSWTKFVDDFKDKPELLAKFNQKPGLVEVWGKLINQPEWVRRNTKLLDKLSRESDEFIKKVDNFYTTTMKNNTPANFDGAGRYTNNVYFDEFGFPDFSEFNPIGNQHVFPNAIGKRADDFKAAKKWMQDKPEIEDYLDLSKDQTGGSPFKVKINGKWSKKMTWHHHENGKDLIPVLSDIHNTTKHTGGVKIVELELTKITN